MAPRCLPAEIWCAYLAAILRKRGANRTRSTANSLAAPPGRDLVRADSFGRSTVLSGNPGRIVGAICNGRVGAAASTEIVNEYTEVIGRLARKLRKEPRFDQLAQFVGRLEFVAPARKVKICRDPDDGKFIECAIDVGRST